MEIPWKYLFFIRLVYRLNNHRTTSFNEETNNLLGVSFAEMGGIVKHPEVVFIKKKLTLF